MIEAKDERQINENFKKQDLTLARMVPIKPQLRNNIPLPLQDMTTHMMTMAEMLDKTCRLL